MKDKKTILVTGATGLIGKPLCQALSARGHQVRTLSRGDKGDFQWDVKAGQFEDAALEGVDAIVHLAGESVAQRWTIEAKERILSSRVEGTKLLVQAILEGEARPAFISASGISYYGIKQSGPLNEEADTGEGFLAEVTRLWEGAAAPLSDACVRTVFMRTGIVLSSQGGALAKMLTPFRVGIGGRIGDGRQQMSWISLDDLVSMYVFAVENESVTGPVNAVAPEPVSNNDFTRTLGKVLGRPTIFPLPAAVVKTLFGEMGEETVLSDLAVLPAKLKALGFAWQHAELEAALHDTL